MSTGNVTSMTAAHLGADGTPLVDDPTETAERQSRLADELAALADQLLTVLEHQDTAIGLVTPADDRSAASLGMAAKINARAAQSVELIRDSLGEQHVVCDELADRLRHLLPVTFDDPAAGGPRSGEYTATLAGVNSDEIEGGEVAA